MFGPKHLFTVTVTPASIRCSANSNASRHNISSSAVITVKVAASPSRPGTPAGGMRRFRGFFHRAGTSCYKDGPVHSWGHPFPARFDSGICYEITRWITADDAARLRRHYFFSFKEIPMARFPPELSPMSAVRFLSPS